MQHTVFKATLSWCMNWICIIQLTIMILRKAWGRNTFSFLSTNCRLQALVWSWRSFYSMIAELQENTYIGTCVLSLLPHQDVKLLALSQQEVSCDVDTMWPAHGQYASTASCTIGCYPGGVMCRDTQTQTTPALKHLISRIIILMIQEMRCWLHFSLFAFGFEGFFMGEKVKCIYCIF